MTEPRAGFAHYRELLDAHGFRPSKRLGQNFLLDPSLHRAIADAAELAPTDTALEVGAGLGFLTRELAARAGAVVAVEIDHRLAEIVGAEVATWEHGARVRLVRSDALAGEDLARPVVAAVRQAFGSAGSGGIAVVSNLPYALSGRFLAVVLSQTELAIDRAVVVVQRELASRLAAAAASPDYGSLSVLAQTRGPVEVLRAIGRDVFRPRPRVDSALVRVRCASPPLPGFAPFLRAAFAGRRKTLRHALHRIAPARAGELDADWGRRRAEECTSDELVALFRLCTE